jgi:hypothetical protein
VLEAYQFYWLIGWVNNDDWGCGVGAMTLSIMAFSIMRLSIMTLSIMTLSKTTLCKMTFSITINKTRHRITTFSILTRNSYDEFQYAECHN